MERFHQVSMKKKSLVGVKLMQEPGFAAPCMEAMHKRHQNFLPRDPNDDKFKSTPILNISSKQPGERRAMSSISFYASKSSRSEDNSQKHRSNRFSNGSSHRRPKGSPAEVPPPFGICGKSLSIDTSKVSIIPQHLLKILGTREVPILGKVRVSVRLSPLMQCGEPSILTLDKKNRLVIHEEPKANLAQFNRIGVSAPKVYAFDQVFSQDDTQGSVVAKVVPDILQAVLGGNDGCILSYGGSGMGKTYTMVLDNGIMPSTISWLYQAVNHLRSHNSVKFSIRISAAVVDASGKSISDALASCASESEIFPSALLRQGYLSSLAELRAPSQEEASKYINLALSYRNSYNTNKPTGALGASTLLVTLHVYQQSMDAKDRGRVVGARSRLHLLDLGDMSGHNKGSLSLSGLTSVLLSIFNGKKYLPHKSNKLTHLLQEALGSVTCHASMIVHVSSSQRHSQHTLATLQLASRVHRLRRKKVKGLFGLASSKSNSSEGSSKRSSGGSSAGSSSIDFSSSEQSADTVIYMGGGEPGDSTDGEHPPMFFSHHIRRHRSVELPRLGSLEQLQGSSSILTQNRRPTSASPTPTSRSAPLGLVRGNSSRIPQLSRSVFTSSNNSIDSKSGFFRHQPGVSRINYADNEQSSTCVLSSPLVEQQIKRSGNLHYSFYREPNMLVPMFSNAHQMHNALQATNSVPLKTRKSSRGTDSSLNYKHKESLVSDEQWIDGPRVSKHRSKISPNSQPETWVDGPSSVVKLTMSNYGYMDDQKKSMIEMWVQNQSAQIGGSETKTKASLMPTQPVDQKKPNNFNISPEENLITSFGEDVAIESDIDTISEDQSANLVEGQQPNLITELERKNLIPPVDVEPYKSEPIQSFNFKLDSSEKEEISIDDVCSQCEALSEECKEFSSLCEEEMNIQSHQGLATVVEEPELESFYGRVEDPIDMESLINHPQTDQEEEDHELTSEYTNNKDDHCRRRSMAVKKTADCSVQVYQEDIARSLCTTPCPSEFSASEISDDHPLRVLSEENLSCSSTFTDFLSQSDEICSDLMVDNETNMLEGSEYFYDTNYLHNLNCQELTTLHNHLSALKGNHNPLNERTNILPSHNEVLSRATNAVENKNVFSLHKSNSNNLYLNSNVDHPVKEKICYQKETESFLNFDKCTTTDQNTANLQQRELLLSASSLHCFNEQPITKSRIILPIISNSTFNQNAVKTSVNPTQNEIKLICDPSSVFSCGSLMNSYSNEVVSPTDNGDSDCNSNTSDDSTYIVRSSKFSKFLCVGLGRSKSKSSAKNSKLKIKDERKSFLKLNKNKYKISSNASSKFSKQDTNSKNLSTSPSLVPVVTKESRLNSEVCQNTRSTSDSPLDKNNGYLEESKPHYQNVSINRHDWIGASNTAVHSCGGTSQNAMPPSCQVKTTITTSGSLGTTQSLGESSGYESILRDSECSSFSSSQESEADEEYRRENKFLRHRISFKKCSRSHPSPNVHEEDSGTHKHLVEGSKYNVLKKLSK